MDTAAFALAVSAFVFAIAALRAARGHAQALDDVERDGRRRVENLREELETELGALREHVAQLADAYASGENGPSGEMVRGSQLWRDVLPTEAADLVAAGGLRIVDVRSPRETADGIVPGAILLPVDELEERARELPKDGKPTLVYCAGGGRSAAACHYLSSEGWTGLMNLQGGMSSWPGPVEKPDANA